MNRLLAALVVLVLVASLLRTRGAEPVADLPADGAATSERELVPASPSATVPAGALLRIELHAEVAWNATGPPLELRLRARDGAERPFDVTVREAQTRQKLAVAVTLPVARPELPLRGELLGDAWCIPPGTREFQVGAIDSPYRLVLVRARAFAVVVLADDSGAPLAGAELLHESGVKLATTGLDGRAQLVRPKNRDPRRDELLLARANGFLSAACDDTAGDGTRLRLRAVNRAGVLRGRVVDAAGAAVPGAVVSPRYQPAGAPPDDPAASALHRWLVASSARELPALVVTSDAAGRFELPIPWPGAVVVTARTRALGRVSATLPEAAGSSDGGHVSEIELRFPPLFELRVEARRDGRPLAHAAFELVQRDGANAVTIAAATSDLEGRLQLRAPAVAPLWLVARAEGVAPQVHELIASPDHGNDVAVAFAPGRSVTFTVTGAESLPPEQRIVAWRDAASHYLLGERPLAADGRVTLDHVPEGRKLELRVAAGEPEGRLLRELELPVAADGAPAPPLLDLGALALPGD